jgi:protein-S-isoprenylcysteine O-methyltransferase Ste14
MLFVLFIGPGPVIGLLPFMLSGWRFQPPIAGCQPLRFVGGALLAIGLTWLTAAIVRFVRDGRGTPAAYAPTERLVVTGPYRYVRNPMYLAVAAMIVGQGLLFGSGALLIYGAIALAAFEASVVFYEEPYLARTYGEQYAAYCKSVRRWLPRVRPWST